MTLSDLYRSFQLFLLPPYFVKMALLILDANGSRLANSKQVVQRQVPHPAKSVGL